MANFINIPPGTLTYDTTNLIGQVVETATRFDGTPKAVRLVMDWLAAGASTANPSVSIGVDLQAKKDIGIDAIRSIYIDNSGSAAPIFVLFPDLQYTVVAAPQTIVIAPVATAALKFIAYGIGFEDDGVRSTIIHAYNFYQPGLVMQVSVEGVQPPVIPEVPAAQGTFLYSRNTLAQTAMSFPNVPLGTPDTNRVIVVCFTLPISGATPQAGNPTITIAGIAATVIQSDLNRYDILGNKPMNNVLAYAVVPTGTVGTINVTLATALGIAPSFEPQASIGVFGIINAQATAPVGSMKTASVGLGIRAVNPAQLDDGYAVLFAIAQETSASSSPVAVGTFPNGISDGSFADVKFFSGDYARVTNRWGHYTTLGNNPVLNTVNPATVVLAATWR